MIVIISMTEHWPWTNKKENHDFPFLSVFVVVVIQSYTPTDTKPKWDDQQKVSNLAFVIFILLYFRF